MSSYYKFFFFFFQAEDGIRDIGVTGVQTCALPIFGFAADRCTFIDDSPANVAAARQAGLTAVQFVGADALRDDLVRLGIGKGSCRGRGEISVVGGSFKKKKKQLIIFW